MFAFWGERVKVFGSGGGERVGGAAALMFQLNRFSSELQKQRHTCFCPDQHLENMAAAWRLHTRPKQRQEEERKAHSTSESSRCCREKFRLLTYGWCSLAEENDKPLIAFIKHSAIFFKRERNISQLINQPLITIKTVREE